MHGQRESQGGKQVHGRKRPVVVMGAKYSGSLICRAFRAGLGAVPATPLQLVQELLGELEALGVFLGLDRYAQLQRALEPIVTIRVLHQPYDRARVHLVLFLEQRIATLRHPDRVGGFRWRVRPV